MPTANRCEHRDSPSYMTNLLDMRQLFIVVVFFHVCSSLVEFPQLPINTKFMCTKSLFSISRAAIPSHNSAVSNQRLTDARLRSFATIDTLHAAWVTHESRWLMRWPSDTCSVIGRAFRAVRRFPSTLEVRNRSPKWNLTSSHGQNWSLLVQP